MNEGNPQICFVFQFLENFGIEDENGENFFTFLERVKQACIVLQAQISSEPKDGSAFGNELVKLTFSEGLQFLSPVCR
jgi:hypothetical protein